MKTPLLHTPEHTAELLGLGRTKVFELMATGELKSVKIGRARRVPLAAIDEYVARLLDEQASGPAAA